MGHHAPCGRLSKKPVEDGTGGAPRASAWASTTMARRGDLGSQAGLKVGAGGTANQGRWRPPRGEVGFQQQARRRGAHHQQPVSCGP
jgi:hypothetical protein